MVKFTDIQIIEFPLKFILISTSLVPVVSIMMMIIRVLGQFVRFNFRDHFGTNFCCDSPNDTTNGDISGLAAPRKCQSGWSYSQQCSKEGITPLHGIDDLTTVMEFHLLPGKEELLMNLSVESLSLISSASRRKSSVPAPSL